ncbi:ABC transporter substrate-binding protein [Streptomyces albiaxialis]|uniref:ABC transporter substrate-binding protein n=1 Tax=Streptomyces albiaxialis TaxID=329523 RepID=A0ABN2VZD6_9ACTN
MTRAVRALLGVLLLVLTAAAAGCGGTAELGSPEERPVAVLGPWTGDQEEDFRALLDRAGVRYTYQGTAAQREVLLSQVQSGSPPDIALLPGPGELADYARKGHLASLEGLYEPVEYGGEGPWQPVASGTGGSYWVPVKADVKSLVWYRAGGPRPDGSTVGQWCLGMIDDGASGWPGSDWIEDIVLQGYGTGIYERWAGGTLPWTDERIAAAWREWGLLLAQDDGSGGEDGDGRGDRGGGSAARRALLTDHRGKPGAHGLLFGGGRRSCALEHQGTFAPFFYGERASDARFVSSRSLLPGGPYMYEGPERSEVSADFAVLFKSGGGPPGDRRKLLSFLASTRGQRALLKTTGYFSANSTAYPGAPGAERSGERIARRLTGKESERCLDASDVMPPAVRDAFYEEVLRFLTAPAKDPLPRLRAIQSIQRTERARLGLGPGTPWMRGVCT